MTLTDAQVEAMVRDAKDVEGQFARGTKGELGGHRGYVANEHDPDVGHYHGCCAACPSGTPYPCAIVTEIATYAAHVLALVAEREELKKEGRGWGMSALREMNILRAKLAEAEAVCADYRRAINDQVDGDSPSDGILGAILSDVDEAARKRLAATKAPA